MTSVDDVFGNMPEKDRRNFIFGSEVEVEFIPTPSIGLTESLGGGWAKGRQATVWGSKSAGKSSFMLQQIAIAQKLGYSCAYFDVEHGFDKRWAAKLGVNNDELIYRNATSINKIMDDGKAIMRAGVDVMIIDSITAMIPAAYLEGDELKPLDKTGALGALARDTSKVLSMFNSVNDDTLLLLVSQTRTKMSATYSQQTATNGQATEYYSQQMVNLFSSQSGMNTIEGEITNGDLVIKKPIGRRVNYKVQFNKLGPEGAQGEYNLYYDGDFVGIDTAGELLDIAVKRGVVRKAGSWYSFNDERLGQGSNAVAEKLRNEPELMEEVKKEIGYS